MAELIPIPEQLIEQLLDEKFNLINSICPECHKLIENVIMRPYAYDKENHNIVYVGKCSYCKKLIYSRD